MGKLAALGVAVACSLLLTSITVSPPIVAGDWARLDAVGKYIPNLIAYAWPSYELQVSLWLGLMLALWWLFRTPTARHIPNIPNAANKYTLPLLVTLILLGFGLRLYSLNRLPLLIDEIGFAARAADILHGQHIPIFAPGHNGNPSVFSWLLAGLMSVFGQNIFAARLVSLGFGTLCIPAAYALGRSWWSRRLGLVAAAFLATYPAHVHFSRLALYNIVDPFFALLALALLVRALRGGRVAAFAWVGIWAGIAQYFYHGSRLVPVLIAVYLVFHFVTAKNRNPKSTPILKGILVTGFTFALVSLPRFAPMLTANLPFTGNLEGIRLPADFGANAVRAFLAWVGEPDVSPFWLGRSTLLPLLALFAAGAGLLICLRRLRDPRSVTLLAAVLLTSLFGGVIWPAAPLYVRYMTAVPAIVLLVALPFEYIFKRGTDVSLTAQQSALTKRAALLLITLIIVQGAILSLQHTNEAYMRVPAGLWESDTLARAAAQLPDGVEARLKVSYAFGEAERVTIADYIAFYGQRRAVSITK